MIDVIVKSITTEATDINSYELSRVDGGALPSFSAGSHIDLHLPNGMIRQYSLCNHPNESHRYLIGVLKDPASRGGSKAVHEMLNTGEKLKISEPRNLFPLVHDAKYTILFAGGIGITPILCMAERLAHIDADFEMHYCSRSIDRAAFIDRIKNSAFADRVHFHFDDESEHQKLDALSILANSEASKHLYVCGPSGFINHIINTAKSLNWAEAQIHREFFSAEPTSEACNSSFKVKISSTGKIFNIPADKTVVEVLATEGIDIPLSCEQGICGTCLTRVLEGVPDHRDMFLTEAERTKNDQFTPCCSRSKTPILVLDV